jgi:hypothetical protein
VGHGDVREQWITFIIGLFLLLHSFLLAIRTGNSYKAQQFMDSTKQFAIGSVNWVIQRFVSRVRFLVFFPDLSAV